MHHLAGRAGRTPTAAASGDFVGVLELARHLCRGERCARRRAACRSSARIVRESCALRGLRLPCCPAPGGPGAGEGRRAAPGRDQQWLPRVSSGRYSTRWAWAPCSSRSSRLTALASPSPIRASFSRCPGWPRTSVTCCCTTCSAPTWPACNRCGCTPELPEAFRGLCADEAGARARVRRVPCRECWSSRGYRQFHPEGNGPDLHA